MLLLGSKDQVVVPPVVGQTLEQASQRLDRAGLGVEVKRRADQAPRDFVFEQSPNPGQKIDKDSIVTLFVSNGPSTVKVPDVVGLDEADARRRVRNADLRPDRRAGELDQGAAGHRDQDRPGAGRLIERNSSVTLFVSSGPSEVAVPNVVGEDQESAVARLRDGGSQPDRARAVLERARRHGGRPDAGQRPESGRGLVRDDLRVGRQGARRCPT